MVQVSAPGSEFASEWERVGELLIESLINRGERSCAEQTVPLASLACESCLVKTTSHVPANFGR